LVLDTGVLTFLTLLLPLLLVPLPFLVLLLLVLLVVRRHWWYGCRPSACLPAAFTVVRPTAAIIR
jgi:hypothetical protein